MAWRPDLVTLKLFVSVCEERSLSRAADREAVVVSAVSKRLSEFEEATGVQLLLRHPKGIELTAAGTATLARARLILAATDLLREDLEGFAHGVRGSIRMLAALSAGVESFASDTASFVRENPQISLKIEERMAQDIIEGLRAGEADIGLGFASAAALDLHQTPYALNNLAVFAGPAHPLHGRESVKLVDLLRTNLVALSATSGTTMLLTSLAARESETITYRAFTSNLDMAFRIIADGSAVGVFGELAGVPLQSWYQVRPIRIDEDWAARQVVIFTRDAVPNASPTRRLLEHLVSRRTHAAR